MKKKPIAVFETNDMNRKEDKIRTAPNNPNKRSGPETHRNENPPITASKMQKPRKTRRRLTAAYKLHILNEADNCSEPGQITALLRREGLYSSSLARWRKQRNQGMLKAMAPKKRGRKSVKKSPAFEKLTRLEKENRQLRTKLRQAERIIEVQRGIFRDPEARPDNGKHHKQKLLSAAVDLRKDVGVVAACEALQIPRTTFYRFQKTNVN
ncbi:MAG: transposase [Desulfobacterales bacterium]